METMKKLLYSIGFTVVSFSLLGYKDAESLINKMAGPNASVEQKWNSAMALREHDWLRDKIKNKPVYKKFANKLLAEYWDKGDILTGELLLSLGADPNIYNLSNEHPILLSSITVKEIPEIKLLLKYGANPNILMKNKESILGFLTIVYTEEIKPIIDLLFKESRFRINVNIKNGTGIPPLYSAIIRLYTEHEEKDEKAFHAYVDFIKFLIEHGASPTIGNGRLDSLDISKLYLKKAIEAKDPDKQYINILKDIIELMEKASKK